MARVDLEASGALQGTQGLNAPLLQAEVEAAEATTDWKGGLQCLLVDILGFFAFWNILPLWAGLDNGPYYCVWLILLVAATSWRLFLKNRRRRGDGDQAALEEKQLPYTTGLFTDASGKQLYMVATVHISPKSPEDTEAVIGGVRPDVVMIELDEERLDNMRPKVPEPPKAEDLQLLKFSGPGVAEAIGEAPILAARAAWNAEGCGKIIKGNIVFNDADEYGLRRPFDLARDNVLLVRRGPLLTEAERIEKGFSGVGATFPVKAHLAAAGGAKALVVIDNTDELPSQRLGQVNGHLAVEIKVAYLAKSMGFPPIPCVMVTKSHGERLLQLCRDCQQIEVEFEVKPDLYPRRTLRRGLCQTCLLFGSGVGFLYGIIRCFEVEVGGEFAVAEKAATDMGVPCVCIDSNMNELWSRMLKVTMPTPWNFGRVVWSWLALPRCAFRLLFPRSDSVDTLGSMVLHAKSFPLKNWIAFIIAGCGANFVSSNILKFLSTEATNGAIDGGMVKQKNADIFQVLLLNAVLMYLMPCLYEAVLVSRDEAMYQGICAKARSSNARCMVAVTGAAHTNGILQRCRERGF